MVVKFCPTEKTLGLWCTATAEIFEYKFVAGEMVIVMKRQWLFKISTIFDPMELVAPFIVQARILIQRMWVKGYEKIGGDIETTCQNWLNEIYCLSEDVQMAGIYVQISRWMALINMLQILNFMFC